MRILWRIPCQITYFSYFLDSRPRSFHESCFKNARKNMRTPKRKRKREIDKDHGWKKWWNDGSLTNAWFISNSMAHQPIMSCFIGYIMTFEFFNSSAFADWITILDVELWNKSTTIRVQLSVMLPVLSHIINDYLIDRTWSAVFVFSLRPNECQVYNAHRIYAIVLMTIAIVVGCVCVLQYTHYTTANKQFSLLNSFV